MSYPITPREGLFFNCKKSKKLPAKCDLSVADPGEGPLFLDQTKGRKVKKKFLTPPLLIPGGLDDRPHQPPSPPQLSEGLDLPLFIHNLSS